MTLSIFWYNAKSMSPFLRILENEVQLAALAFLGVVYFIRVLWLLRFRSGRPRTWPAGSASRGVRVSLANVAMPWAMESTRKDLFFYAQFVVFHIGVAASIGATFIVPYAPAVFRIKAVVLLFQVVIGAAFIAGLWRLYRRLSDPALRLVSSADDYASIVLMIAYFASAVLAVPNTPEKAEWPLAAFFGLTAFFLVYVPFSKIGHYLYYPFTRYFLGRTLGHRGSFPAPAADDPRSGRVRVGGGAA